MLEELVGRVLFENLAVRHEDDAVGGLAREAHLVGHADHRHAFMREFDHHVEHFVDHFRVECGSGLVEQHDLGAHGERAGDGHTLLLAAGELGGHLAGLGVDAHAGEQVHGQLLGFLLVHVTHLDEGQRHVFKNGFVGEQVERLEHHANFGPEVRELLAFLWQGLAVDADVAGIDGLEAIDGAAHRGLA